MQFLFKNVERGGGIFFAIHIPLVAPFRLGQRTLVHLLVLVQRDGVNLHRDSGHHIGRLLLEDEVVQGLDVYLLVADDVGGNELATALALHIEGLDRGVLDAGELTDDGLDLFQLDAEATNLHLSVTTAYELQVARRQVAHDVARTIDTRILRIRRKGIGDIHLGRLLRTVQIAAAHLGTANPEFTSRTNGQTMTLGVNDIEPHVVKRLANGYLAHTLFRREDGGEDGTLRRSIYIIETVTLRRGERRQLLTACREMQQRVVLDAGGKLIAHLRRHKRVGDLLALEVVVQGHQVEADFLGDDV